jgi:AcrR family transcriptional regulator
MSRERRRSEIVQTALAIADREGFEAVSMRRIASELGVGTMSLYTYVANKDALLFEMGEALGAEILVPEGELSGDWREAVRQIARRSYASVLRHPWILRLVGEEPPFGPSFARHFDQSLQAVAGLDADVATRQAIMRTVDALVFGCVLDDLDEQEHRHGDEAFVGRVRDLAESEGLEHILQALDEGPLVHVPVLEQGLDWLIAGIEASVVRR